MVSVFRATKIVLSFRSIVIIPDYFVLFLHHCYTLINLTLTSSLTNADFVEFKADFVEIKADFVEIKADGVQLKQTNEGAHNIALPRFIKRF